MQGIPEGKRLRDNFPKIRVQWKNKHRSVQTKDRPNAPNQGPLTVFRYVL